jgi:transposase
LLDRLDPRTIVLADKACDADGIRDLIEAQRAVPNIPPKSNRKWKPCFSKVLYRERRVAARPLYHFGGSLTMEVEAWRVRQLA